MRELVQLFKYVVVTMTSVIQNILLHVKDAYSAWKYEQKQNSPFTDYSYSALEGRRSGVYLFHPLFRWYFKSCIILLTKCIILQIY